MLELSNSRVSMFRSCRAKHRYAYVLRRRRKGLDSWYLRFGRGMHDQVMEPAYGFFDNGEIKSDELDSLSIKALNAIDEALDRDAIKPGGKPEQEFAFEISPGVLMRGKIDVSYDDFFVEHKSTSSWLAPQSDYWKRLEMDTQVSNYFLGQLSLTGKLPTHCEYNVVKRPSLKAMKSEKSVDTFVRSCLDTPEKVFYKKNIYRLEAELRLYEDEVALYAQDILRSIATGNAPRNPSACFDYASECEYRPVCLGLACIDDDELYEDRPLHPELSEGGVK